jgi:ferritin-like metal-binding protein YciE
MQTAHELFVHELQDLLDAEQQLVEALGEQAEESSRPELQKAFQAHQEQTQNQVERLHQVFESIGEDPEETECAGIRGLIQEHQNFKQEDPSEDILDIFNAGAAEKVESYEICAYESAIRLAQQMEHTKAVKLLNQSLKEEQHTLKKMQAFSKKLKPENMGMEEMEEQEEHGEEQETASSGSSRKKGSGRAGSRRRVA